MSQFQDFLDQHPCVSRIDPTQRCGTQKSPNSVHDLYRERQCKKNTTYWYDGPAPHWMNDTWSMPMCRQHLVSQVLGQEWLVWRRRAQDAARSGESGLPSTS